MPAIDMVCGAEWAVRQGWPDRSKRLHHHVVVHDEAVADVKHGLTANSEARRLVEGDGSGVLPVDLENERWPAQVTGPRFHMSEHPFPEPLSSMRLEDVELAQFQFRRVLEGEFRATVANW
jgi:hypothetical protein